MASPPAAHALAGGGIARRAHAAKRPRRRAGARAAPVAHLDGRWLAAPGPPQRRHAAATRGDTEPEAFTVFYERHVDMVLAFLRRRTSSPEVAADLMAETFAAALLGLHTGTAPEEIEVPIAWLLGIARNKLFESYRRGKVEAAARERLGLEPLVLDDTDLALVDELSETDLVRQLADLLPPDQLEALRARVIDERDDEDIARDLQCSEAVVRKRVSRALRTLRTRSAGGDS